MLALVVSFGIESFLEEFGGKNATLGKTIHTHANLHVHPTLVVNNVTQFVFVDDFVRDEV